MSKIDKKSKFSKAQRTLLIMVAVFAVPYLLSWFLYLNPDVLNLGTRNNGTLISPLIGPDEVHFMQSEGQAFPLGIDSKSWTLLMFGSSPCGQACRKTLFTLQQLRRMMGVDKARIRRAYVSLGSADSEALQAELAQFEGTELFVLESGDAFALEQKLGIKSGQMDQHIVIADPMGNLVMLYPQDIEPEKIFADIEILFGRVKGV